MHRFYVAASLLAGETVLLEGGHVRQIRKVLRLAAGDRICLFCGDGWEHEAVLLSVTGERVEARAAGRRQPATELHGRLRVGVALLKGDRLEWVIQKLTELGCSEIAFLRTARVVPTAGSDRWSRRLERYAAIAREAAEQSGRVHLPSLAGPLSLGEYLARTSPAIRLIVDPTAPTPLAERLVPHHRSPPGPPYREARPDWEEVTLLVGPEGGFTPEELAQARVLGAEPVSLGRRTLRAETAAIVAAGLAASLMDG